MAQIIYSHEGSPQNKKVLLFKHPAKEIIIGRRKAGLRIDLDLYPDLAVSRPHARISVDENAQYWLEDLKSANGTFVNGERINGKGKVALALNVPVRIGETILKLVVENASGELLEEQVSKDTKIWNYKALEKPRTRKGKSGKPTNELPSLSQLKVEVKCLPKVNYSLDNAGIPFLSKIIVSNTSNIPLQEAELQLTLPGYVESQSINLPLVPAKGQHTVMPLPSLSFTNLDRLQNLPEPEPTALKVVVSKDKLLLSKSVKVSILPPNAWHSVDHEEALAGFVMPNSDAVNEIHREAGFYLRRLISGIASFGDALDSTDPERELKMIQALYRCLQRQYDIRYDYEPRTYADDWQMVRFHYEVIEQLKGTCIDLALLFAACLEGAHLDPVIIIVKTDPYVQHALVGCWRSESPLEQPLVWDGNQVKQWVDRGDLIVLDSVGFASGQFAEQTFSECQKQGKTYLDKACDPVDHYRFLYALDIIAVREKGVTPMPFGKGVRFNHRAQLAIYRARREAAAQQSPAVGARHLLLGLLSLDESLMQQIFAEFGHTVADEVKNVIRASLRRKGTARRILPETSDWKAIMRQTTKAIGPLLVSEADLTRALLDTESQIDRVLTNVDKELQCGGLSRKRCLDILNKKIGPGSVPSEWDSAAL